MRNAILVLGILLVSARPFEAQTLKYIETHKPDILNPVAGARSVVGVRILELVFRGLLSQDRYGEWVPELAEAVPSFTPGDMELIVSLPPDIKWPDGHKLTAKDVAFSFKVYMDPGNSYGNRNILEIFDAVEAISERQVKFTLNQSHRRAVSRIGFSVMPEHQLIRTELDPKMGYSKQPMGAGPFAVSHVEDNLIRFRQNLNYPRATSSIDSVELIVNASDAVHSVMLLADQVHLDPVVRPDDVAVLRANSQTDVRGYDSKEWSGFAYNCKSRILRFREVRQALSYLFDRSEALSANFLKYGDLVSGPFTQSSFCWNPDVEPRPHDPMLADQLLDSVGLLDLDQDGWREYSNERIVLRMVLSRSMSEANKSVCADFVQQLKEHMIKVDVDYQDDAVWHERVFYDHDYDISFMVWKFDDASNVYPLFSLTQSEPGQYNVVQFAHDGVEALLNQFRTSGDDIERAEVGKKLHRLLHDEVPYTFLWSLKKNAGIRIDKIRRISIDPFYFFRTIGDWKLYSDL